MNSDDVRDGLGPKIRNVSAFHITKILGALGVIAPSLAPRFEVDPPMEPALQWRGVAREYERSVG